MKNRNKCFLILFAIICLLASGCLFKSNEKVVSIFKNKVFANSSRCLISGTTSANAEALVVTANGFDATSGISTWQCYENGSWGECSNSTGCNDLSFSGWTGVTSVKTEDVAGNVSDSKSLYSIRSVNFAGNRSNGNSFSDSDPSHIKAVNIIGSTETKGSISNVSIVDNGTSKPSQVVVTGFPEYYSETGYNYTYTTPTTTKKTYVCAAGTPTFKNGSWRCVGDDYRLQNETCSCVFQKKSDGSFEEYTEWAKVATNDITCARAKTYCTDNYNKNVSDDIKIKDITSRTSQTGTNCNQAIDGDGCFSNSGSYTRKPNSTCYTYYIKDGNGNHYTSNFQRNDFIYYYEFANFVSNENGNFVINDGMKKIMIDASENGKDPCSTSNDDYYSNRSLLTSSGLCQNLLNKFNANKNNLANFNYTEMSNDVYIIPITSSATCQFIEGNASAKKPPNNNAITIGSGEDEYYMYCTDGSQPKLVDGAYKCEKMTPYTKTGYKYDWTVTYYRK